MLLQEKHIRGQGHTNVTLYPLYHVTYVPAKFEDATSNGLGDAFTRKNNNII